MIARLQRALPFFILMALAAVLWMVADGFDYRPRAGRPGPDLWPKIVLTLMFVAAAWGALQALLTPVDADDMASVVRMATRVVGREDETASELSAEAGPTSGAMGFAIGGMIALFGFVGLIPWVGYTVATFLLMSSIMWLSGVRRATVLLTCAIAGTVGFFIVFQKIAYISLPLGEGPFRAFSLALMALFGVR